MSAPRPHSPLQPLSATAFKSIRQLLTRKARSKSGSCLLEGRRFVTDALAAGAAVEHLLATERFAAAAEGRELLAEAARRGIRRSGITERQLGQLSDTVTAQGVVAVAGTPGASLTDLLELRAPDLLLVAVDGVTDPGNAGTIIRTCAWFGVDGVLLSEGSVELSNPKLLRATMGAVFRLPVVEGVRLAEAIPGFRKLDYTVFAAEAGAPPPGGNLSSGGRRLLLFGSEAHGISPPVRGLADSAFGIPGAGTVESLNVSVAVGIALHAARGA